MRGARRRKLTAVAATFRRWPLHFRPFRDSPACVGRSVEGRPSSTVGRYNPFLVDIIRDVLQGPASRRSTGYPVKVQYFCELDYGVLRRKAAVELPIVQKRRQNLAAVSAPQPFRHYLLGQTD